MHVANFKDADGNTVAQKLRYPDKTFAVVGDLKKAVLFGQNLWRDGGKSCVVVEGELDALSMSQAFDNKWAVVSIKTGAAGAVKDIKKSIKNWKPDLYRV